jgi:hypothetical protein
LGAILLGSVMLLALWVLVLVETIQLARERGVLNTREANEGFVAENEREVWSSQHCFNFLYITFIEVWI